MATALSADDKKWRAKDDARTLAEATVIGKDPERLDAAKVAATEMADEQAEQAKAMRGVAGRKGRGAKKDTGTRGKGRSGDVGGDSGGRSTAQPASDYTVFNRV